MKKSTQNQIQKFNELQRKLEDLKTQQIQLEAEIEHYWENKKSTPINGGAVSSAERIPYTEEVFKVFQSFPDIELRAEKVKQIMDEKFGSDRVVNDSIKATLIYLKDKGKIDRPSRGEYKLKTPVNMTIEKVAPVNNQPTP